MAQVYSEHLIFSSFWRSFDKDVLIIGIGEYSILDFSLGFVLIRFNASGWNIVFQTFYDKEFPEECLVIIV